MAAPRTRAVTVGKSAALTRRDHSLRDEDIDRRFGASHGFCHESVWQSSALGSADSARLLRRERSQRAWQVPGPAVLRVVIKPLCEDASQGIVRRHGCIAALGGARFLQTGAARMAVT